MTQPTPTPVPILNQRYVIEEKLGAGRLAVVYRARDELLQRQVLVHMLRKELVGQEPLRRRFLDDASANARRSHQSLLEVFDTGELAGRPYVVTEYVAGRALSELGALAVEDALLYFRQVVGAVAVCQAAGVPHPPICSANVMLVADGHVELVESWTVPPSQLALDLAAYRAPERSEGHPPTPASTVYALGLLLFEMLAGRRAVSGPDPQTIAQAHLALQLPPLREFRPAVYAPALQQLLDRATARRPEERFPNAASLAEALDEARRQTAAATQPLGVRPARPRPAPAAPPPAPPHDTPLAPDAGDTPPPPAVQNRSWGALLLVVLLFVVVACGAYLGASALFDRLLNVRLPAPSVPGVQLPGWLTGVVGGGGQVLIVTGADLNLRAAPGRDADVLGVLPNGSRVRRLAGPRLADNIPWYRVRAAVDGREVEGWVSGNFLKTEDGGDPSQAR
jgi:hypothetical protein